MNIGGIAWQVPIGTGVEHILGQEVEHETADGDRRARPLNAYPKKQSMLPRAPFLQIQPVRFLRLVLPEKKPLAGPL